jgi:hypothetical protein
MSLGFRDEMSLSPHELIEEIKELREIVQRQRVVASQQTSTIESLRAQLRSTVAIVQDYVPPIEDDRDY